MTYTPNSPVKELQLHRPRLSAWLELAGEPAPLLDPRLVKSTNTVCTCVESTPGQEYVLAFRLEMDRPEVDVCVDVTVDGRALPGLWLPRGHGFWATAGESQERIVRIGAGGAKSGLSFAELEDEASTEGAAGKRPANTKLGTIQLDLNYLYQAGTSSAPSSPVRVDTASSSYQPSAEPFSSSPPQSTDTDIEVTSTRIVGFSFFYRSRATLLATGILPSASASAPTPINTHATPIKALPARFAALNSKTPWSAASSPLSQCDSLWGTPVLGGGGGLGSPGTPATPVEEWGRAGVKGGEEGRGRGRGEASSPVRPGDERDVMIGGKRRGSGMAEGQGEEGGMKRRKSQLSA